MVTKSADGTFETLSGTENNHVGIKENVIKLDNRESQGIHYSTN